MHYLYRHIRLDKNEPFYIGIGTIRSISFNSMPGSYRYERAYSKNKRSTFWKNIVAKTNYEVEILIESDNYEFIKQKEIEFIKLYGRRNLGLGTLCNLTDGGEGAIGVVQSEETIKKRVLKNTGKKRSEETKKKMSNSMRGKKLSESHKKLLSDFHRGKKLSTNVIEKIRISNTGKKRSQEIIKIQKERLCPLEKKLQIKRLIEEHYSKKNIKKIVHTSCQTIDNIIKEFDLIYDFKLHRKGWKLSQENKEKIKENLRKRVRTPEAIRKMVEGGILANSKIIFCIDKFGRIEKEFSSIKEALLYVKSPPDSTDHISNAAKTNKLFKGKYWKFKL